MCGLTQLVGMSTHTLCLLAALPVIVSHSHACSMLFGRSSWKQTATEPCRGTFLRFSNRSTDAEWPNFGN